MMRGRRGIALFDGMGRNGGRDGNELDGLHRHSSLLQALDGRHAVSGASEQMYVPIGHFKPVGRARSVPRFWRQIDKQPARPPSRRRGHFSRADGVAVFDRSSTRRGRQEFLSSK
jgi:hypothetical protein